VHMDLLMINDIALSGVAAEVVTNIYNHLKQCISSLKYDPRIPQQWTPDVYA
jgi:hypothetical protein